jgi:hypothetical protein
MPRRNRHLKEVESWICETLPALQRIMVEVGLFVVFAVGFVTIIILLIKRS